MTVMIKAATVVRGFGADKVYLKTDLPYAVWPFEGFRDLHFECAANGAEEYLERNFPGITVEVINR